MKNKNPLPTIIPAEERKELQTVVEFIQQYPCVERIYLYGAYVYPELSLHSWYRLLVILMEGEHQTQISEERKVIMEYCREARIPLQCTPCITDEIKDVCKEGKPFLILDALKEGVLLYKKGRYALASYSLNSNPSLRRGKAQRVYEEFIRKIEGLRYLYIDKPQILIEWHAFCLHQQIELCFYLLKHFFDDQPFLNNKHDLVVQHKIIVRYDVRFGAYLQDTESVEYLRYSYSGGRFLLPDEFGISAELIAYWQAQAEGIYTLTQQVCKEYLNFLIRIEKRVLKK